MLSLPVNQPVYVHVDARLLRGPHSSGAIEFQAGIHCGLVRYHGATKTSPGSDVLAQTENAEQMHDLVVFDQLVARVDRMQLLTYPIEARRRAGRPIRRFAAIDYGFAFGGTPEWSVNSLAALTEVRLPMKDAMGGPYVNGQPQQAIIGRLRHLSRSDIEAITMQPGLTGWGLKAMEATAASDLIQHRAQRLVHQYDMRYRPQIEAFDGPS